MLSETEVLGASVSVCVVSGITGNIERELIATIGILNGHAGRHGIKSGVNQFM